MATLPQCWPPDFLTYTDTYSVRLITSSSANLLREPTPLLRCGAEDVDGYIRQEKLWGVYPNEKVE